MSKRFIDSDLFKKRFIRGLEAPNKLLWVFLFCECDFSGIWNIDLEIASIYTGHKITMAILKTKFNDHVVFLENDAKLFLPDFIEFQYGALNPQNSAHRGVIKKLIKYQLLNDNNEVVTKPLDSPYEGAKDMDKDKDKDKEEEKKQQKKKEFIPPTLEDVQLYFKTNGYENADRFFHGYKEAGWVDSKGQKILNWKQKAQQVWFKPENKTKTDGGQLTYDFFGKHGKDGQEKK